MDYQYFFTDSWYLKMQYIRYQKAYKIFVFFGALETYAIWKSEQGIKCTEKVFMLLSKLTYKMVA